MTIPPRSIAPTARSSESGAARMDAPRRRPVPPWPKGKPQSGGMPGASREQMGGRGRTRRGRGDGVQCTLLPRRDDLEGAIRSHRPRAPLPPPSPRALRALLGQGRRPARPASRASPRGKRRRSEARARQHRAAPRASAVARRARRRISESSSSTEKYLPPPVRRSAARARRKGASGTDGPPPRRAGPPPEPGRPARARRGAGLAEPTGWAEAALHRTASVAVRSSVRLASPSVPVDCVPFLVSARDCSYVPRHAQAKASSSPTSPPRARHQEAETHVHQGRGCMAAAGRRARDPAGLGTRRRRRGGPSPVFAAPPRFRGLLVRGGRLGAEPSQGLVCGGVSVGARARPTG